jgi:hypothetical protein
VPIVRPGIVVSVPVPTMAPGLIAHTPVGKPVSSTLPVAVAQFGCVGIPATGAVGAPENGLISTVSETGEIHPLEFVTVKL